jgi:hypothetical protein
MMPDDEKALTIARRTRKNLDFIYTAKAQGADVEEVTQLLNSMLGMLICLREEYFHGKSVTWNDVQNMGLIPVSVKTSARTRQHDPMSLESNSFSQLITHLRHAFAHNNFELVGNRSKPKSQQEIIGFVVWNMPTSGPKFRTWQAELSVDELKDIAYLFIAYLEKTRGHELATA